MGLRVGGRLKTGKAEECVANVLDCYTGNIIGNHANKNLQVSYLHLQTIC